MKNSRSHQFLNELSIQLLPYLIYFDTKNITEEEVI